MGLIEKVGEYLEFILVTVPLMFYQIGRLSRKISVALERIEEASELIKQNRDFIKKVNTHLKDVNEKIKEGKGLTEVLEKISEV